MKNLEIVVYLSGATAFCKMTLSIMTFSIMTLSIKGLYVRLSISYSQQNGATTFSITTFSIMTLSISYSQLNGA